MPGIRSISFLTEGWTLGEESAAKLAWGNGLGDILSLNFIALRPDLPSSLSELLAIRGMYRAHLAPVDGALVEVEPEEIASVPVLRTIFKFPQRPHGMSYVGAFTIPRAEFSFVIKVSCAERGVTGMRDAVALDRHLATNPDPIFRGWAQDPYDPTFESPTLRNQSDDEEWDALFPEHPLSRVRAGLGKLRASVVIGDDVRASRPWS